MKLTERNTKAAKLLATQVVEIRQRYAKGETQSSLCRHFGVSIGQIGRIVRNESWQGNATIVYTDESEMARGQANLMAKLGMIPTTEPSIGLSRLAREEDKMKPKAIEDKVEGKLDKLIGDSK